MVKTGKKLVVIGGGAAGFFCAVNAARENPSLQVIILEKTNKLLAKVRVSGGGRCNVTHACFDIKTMSERYPRGKNFVKKTFHQFFTTDTISWFEKRGVILKTEEDGRMFPVTDNSQTIINCLMNEAEKTGVSVRMNSEVMGLEFSKEKFELELNNGRRESADFVCIASGGYPKSSLFGWLKKTGHSIEEPVPSLFTFNLPGHSIKDLMGVSVENIKLKIEGTKLSESGPLLITHWGLSGPAILKLSAWGAKEFQLMNYHFNIHINWIPGKQEGSIKQKIASLRITSPTKKISNLNFTSLPGRLWEYLLKESGINKETRLSELTSNLENSLVRNLVDFTAAVSGKTTFKEEFVTAGGIELSEVDPNTMMSKKLPGLFFAGEVLNVDGITGGYNFQHAWTSGYIAALTISHKQH